MPGYIYTPPFLNLAYTPVVDPALRKNARDTDSSALTAAALSKLLENHPDKEEKKGPGSIEAQIIAYLSRISGLYRDQTDPSKEVAAIWKKIEAIRQNPFHEYKFLKKPLQSYNRVHIDKHFVLIFVIDHKNKIVDIRHYKHHDEVYNFRPRITFKY